MARNRNRPLQQVLTVATMRAAEQALIDAGDTVESLMERAGRGAGAYVHRVAGGRAVTVLCGPGNNGGDGYVIARYLAELDVPVRVIAPVPPRTPAAIAARQAFGGPVEDGIPQRLPHGDVFVDALFGSGLTRALDRDLVALITGLAARHHHRVAIDLPSGIDSDSGAVLNDDAPAYDLTIALGAWKHAHFAMPAAMRMGALRLVDIGCAPVEGAAQVLARPHLEAPAADAHKYTRGLLAIVGGAMPGASMLSALAARHAGAGYLKLIAQADPGMVPADLVVVQAAPGVALADPRVAALLVGPGLGRGGVARERLAAALDALACKVIDADALMLLRPGQGTGAVLTPHEGELAALERAFGVQGDGPRHRRALRLASAIGAVVVAKGPDSVIAAPDGRLGLASHAPSWLSVAGTGDVLAGVIASRLAVTRDPWRAACEGVWLHGEAARLAGPAFAATDLAEAVRLAVRAAL
jgi:ADP-dependent NAD(P)H-hydrate dehydratase / NAD(P)H-hydrate epimerase